MRKLSRRGFLRLVSTGLGASILSSCQKDKTPIPATSNPIPSTPTSRSPTQASVDLDILGTACGINPGRVVWSHNPKATVWDGKNGFWWQAQNTDQALVNEMLNQALCQLTGTSTDRDAWTGLFRYFNRSHHGTEAEYQPGDKIAIKVNLNGCDVRTMQTNNSFTSPYVLFALLNQLVSAAGVPQEDITVYDALRYIPDCMYDYCQENGLTGVHFADWEGGDGREVCQRDLTSLLHWSVDVQGNPTYLPTCVTQVKYLINLASLKGHNLAGVTLCAKNHFGTIQADWKGAPSQNAPQGANIHATIAAHDFNMGAEWTWSQRPMKTYSALVDLMGHLHLGEKTVLFMLDGLYAAQHQSIEISNPSRWQAAPFNQGWSSSILVSQDGVAIDSVGLDFLRNEPTILNTPNVMPANSTCENYLHEAAQADRPASGTVYRPQGDEQGLPSLGVHEHWNNAQERKYSRNVGTGNGIELIAIT
jgi:hypothetical protein